MQYGGVARHQLRCLKKTEPRRAATSKGEAAPGGLDYIGVSGMYAFCRDTGAQRIQCRTLAGDGNLIDQRLRSTFAQARAAL